jgi:FkbM family methyltransferase
MTNRAITVLGTAARAARAVGIGRIVAAGRDAADAGFVRTRMPPLRARSDGVDLRGFLRHRSFLADVARGTPGGYRELLRSVLEPGATFIDGGAHIGLYTIIAARAVGPTGAVIAFEPDPYNCAALELNVHRAGCSNVEVCAMALADRTGVSTFYRSAGTISGSLVARGAGLEDATAAVETTSIDQVLADRAIGALTIKLNIEGAEARAITGARASIARADSTRLFVEVNPQALAAAREAADSLFDLVRKLGFSVSNVTRDETVAPITAATAIRKGHLFCERT